MTSQFYQFFCQMLPICQSFGGYFPKVTRIITRGPSQGTVSTNDATGLQAIGAGSSESKMTHVNNSYLWVIRTAKNLNLRTTLFLHQKICIQINILYYYAKKINSKALGTFIWIMQLLAIKGLLQSIEDVSVLILLINAADTLRYECAFLQWNVFCFVDHDQEWIKRLPRSK